MDRNGGINFCIEMCWRYVSLQKRLEVRRGDLGLHNPIRPSVPISLCDRERKRGRERDQGFTKNVQHLCAARESSCLELFLSKLI